MKNQIMDIRLSQADISDHSWDFSDLIKKESFDSTLIDERCAREWIEALCFQDVNLQAAASRLVRADICILGKAFSTFYDKP